MASKPKPNEIRIVRIYDASVKSVWEAWTDPVQTAKWWGPRGFTLTSHSKDLRVGGIWHYTMHGPDGTDYPNKTYYLEVEKYRRLVYDHGGYDDRPPVFRVTATFTDVDGKTQLEMIMALPTAEEAEKTKKFIKLAGGNSTWDRLAEYLEHESSGNEIFVINRTFQAQQTRLYEMWTDPKHLAKWLPPTGFQMEFIRANVKVGGSSFYKMANDAGMKMFGRMEYLKLEAPHCLEYTQQFCDENENVSRHPAAPTWPETMHTKIVFAEEEPGETRVSIRWSVVGAYTDAELQAFIKERTGMTAGWTGSFDKLEAYLQS
jgi:uncharacterized protein YndB with AHSA1/START domain